MSHEYYLPKIVYQCRRGMLELDVILIPFAEQNFEKLSQTQQQDFVTFLDEADPDLYSWLMGFSEPKPEFASIVKTIREAMANKANDMLQ